MPSPRPALINLLRAAVAGVLLAATTLLSAAEGAFVTTLSAEQRTAAGLGTLSPPELQALDQIITVELSLSRQGNGQELPGTFVSRRTPAERKETGLDRLAPAELAKLDELVATAVLSRPKPKDRPRLPSDDVISARKAPEVHGSLSFTFGRSGSRNFRGTDLWLDYSIPELGLNLGFGLSNYSGGIPYDYYYPGGYGSYYPGRGPLLFDAYPHTTGYPDFPFGTGESFRAASPWVSFDYSRRRN